MNWPLNKEFAFTIIDDTDNASLKNIKPVYDYLFSKNIKTTKTIWIYPSRDKFTGDTIQEDEYLKFLIELEKKGYEIQLHGVGSGNFKRDEIIEGLLLFKEKFGRFPLLNTNHSQNPDNIYWGFKRFGVILENLFKLFKGEKRHFYGDEIQSENFWGDLSKKHIMFMRNRSFNGINTFNYDPRMPFSEKRKIFSNYWFSSSDGHTIREFNDLLTKSNIDKLRNQKGLCIVYTHFACGFVNLDGNLNEKFKENISYLSEQNGWFVPATKILEYILSVNGKKSISNFYINVLDLKWVIGRIIKKLKYGR